MKIRQGFVSNSSSASFVVYWRCFYYEKDENNGSTVEVVINGLIRYNKKLKKYLKENTSETSAAGIYKTTGHISMYNDISDFPAEMAYLVLGLKVEAGYELIDIRTENDY